MKKKALLFTLILMFICTSAFVSLSPDKAQAAISDHVSRIQISMGHDYEDPTDPDDTTYDFELDLNTDDTVVKVKFVSPAGNTFEFVENEPNRSTPGGTIVLGRGYEDDSFEWYCELEAEYAAARDIFGDGTYDITVYYENGNSDQTTVAFENPNTNEPIVEPTQVPTFTNFSHGDVLTSPANFEWNACSLPAITYTCIEISDNAIDEDIVDECFSGCSTASYGPMVLITGSYEFEFEFAVWYDYQNSDGIDVEVGKYSESDYGFTVIGDSDCDGIADDGDNSGTSGDNPCTGGSTENCDDNCPDTGNSNQLDADSDGIGDVCDGTPGCGGCGEDVCEVSFSDKVEELLTHYYENILGRGPDSGGLEYWKGIVIDLNCLGGDIKEGFISMAQAYFYSPEYLGKDRNDTEFVTDLYNTFFDRPPDPGGLAYWLDRIANGATRNEVLDNFVYSGEFNDFMDELFFGTS